MKYVEKEIKLHVKDLKKLVLRLKKCGAAFLNRSKEITTRFDTQNDALAKRGVFLRVRTGSKNTLTLKEKINTYAVVKARKETEFEIGDPPGMIYVLKQLGFIHIRIMEKYRINFRFKGTTVSIDELPFGIYMEIEGSAQSIYEVIKKLEYDPNEKILKTYWDLAKTKDILFPKGFRSQLRKIRI